MPAIIDITSLTRTSEKVDKLLRKLPYLELGPVLAALGINIKEVIYKDTIRQFQRRGGTSKPYSAGTIDYIDEIGKMQERSLIVEDCYSAIKDHIKNLISTPVLNPPEGDKVDNKSKKHPLEQLILETQVRTICEDILDGMFHGTRDTSDKSPMGMLTGFFTQIADEILAGSISTGNGNYKTSGLLSAPATSSDTDAFDALVEWLRGADRFLIKKGNLYIATDALQNVQDAFENKISGKPNDAFEAFIKYLRNKVSAPNLNIISHECLGSGSKLMLSIPRNLDLGMNTNTDEQFVSVRQIFEDPNYVQFWSQWGLGARINSLHKKEFMANEQVNIALELAGDYVS